jgi:hypothetical protein
MIRRAQIPELRKIFPAPDFCIVEISGLGEPAYIAIRTKSELLDMVRSGVKFKIVED